MSIYPEELRLIFFKISPLLFTTTEIPELADLKKNNSEILIEASESTVEIKAEEIK